MEKSHKEEKIPVSRVPVKDSLEEGIEKAVALIGGMGNRILPDDKILVIGNFNSPDRYPASSDSGFLRYAKTGAEP